MNSDEPLFEYFCEYLAQHHGWHFPILAGMCDRCGREGTRRVAMGDPFPVQLELCPACTFWVQLEAKKDYSGLLGLAGVYAFAYAIGRSAVKGAERAPQAPDP